MLSIVFMVFLGIFTLAMLGMAIFEAITHAKGAPSPRLNWIRPILGPLAMVILALWAIWRTHQRRQLACGKKAN